MNQRWVTVSVIPFREDLKVTVFIQADTGDEISSHNAGRYIHDIIVSRKIERTVR
ncbi:MULTISPECIES: hypothetical protein [unclassified Streptomyces]|uniref:hypothetical protein n=1 Tax=unclassified Streptomyces TaxID=2593676 RepID=UPI002E2BE20D|nr:hypothetical protein [Streptomyces sp. NBC_00223]